MNSLKEPMLGVGTVGGDCVTLLASMSGNFSQQGITSNFSGLPHSSPLTFLPLQALAVEAPFIPANALSSRPHP